jgi:hypothetical protein
MNELIEQELKVLRIVYNLEDNLTISFLVTNNYKLKDELIKSILNDKLLKNTIYYDFSKKKDADINYFTKLLLDKNIVITSNLLEYANYLENIKIIPKKESFFMNTFNLPRDGFYKENKVKIIFIITEEEYSYFASSAGDDFLSYALHTTFFDNKKKIYKK